MSSQLLVCAIGMSAIAVPRPSVEAFAAGICMVAAAGSAIAVTAGSAIAVTAGRSGEFGASTP